MKLSPSEYKEYLKQQYEKMSYKEYLQTDWWKWIKSQKIKQVRYKCQKCGKTNTILFVHHNNYKKGRGNEQLSDLSCVCKSCHDRKHLFWKPEKKAA